jgi:hypothetical protein
MMVKEYIFKNMTNLEQLHYVFNSVSTTFQIHSLMSFETVIVVTRFLLASLWLYSSLFIKSAMAQKTESHIIRLCSFCYNRNHKVISDSFDINRQVGI